MRMGRGDGLEGDGIDDICCDGIDGRDKHGGKGENEC